jgi:hypothetical protein
MRAFVGTADETPLAQRRGGGRSWQGRHEETLENYRVAFACAMDKFARQRADVSRLGQQCLCTVGAARIYLEYEIGVSATRCAELGRYVTELLIRIERLTPEIQRTASDTVP